MLNKKMQVWLPLIFAGVMIAGMFFGYKLREKSGSNNFFRTDSKNSISEALELIRQRYVDSVKVDSLEGKAISAIINELDPHSVYLPPVELKEANEDLAGNFQGIGVEFNIFSDTVNVLYVLPNGPGDKAGIQIGDKILQVNGTALTGKKFSTDEIRSNIRGPRGSQAELLLQRGSGQLTVLVTRGTIPVPSIDAAYMINKTTGYIKLNKFTESSYEEFMAALEKLQKEGLVDLVYDLRGNGGGFMNEAVDMADEFLEGTKLIVYTQGANSKRREYRSKRPGLLEKGEIIILVDELSASASEVLAGAVQDWDRGTIVGRRTFGKGLVQEQFDLKGGAAMRLTVARYYTPLGRSIQRPYEKGRKVYMDELWERFSNGELLSADSIKVANGKEFRTNEGKVVYGGGGIMPDVFVPLDTSRRLQQLNRMFASTSFNNFVYNYYLQNRKKVDSYATADAFVSEFRFTDTDWGNFVNYAAKDTLDLSGVAAAEKQLLLQRLKALLARYKWRNSGFFQVLNADDAMVKKGMEILAGKKAR